MTRGIPLRGRDFARLHVNEYKDRVGAAADVARYAGLDLVAGGWLRLDVMGNGSAGERQAGDSVAVIP